MKNFATNKSLTMLSVPEELKTVLAEERLVELNNFLKNNLYNEMRSNIWSDCAMRERTLITDFDSNTTIDEKTELICDLCFHRLVQIHKQQSLNLDEKVDIK
jgi:hypothetical protein